MLPEDALSLAALIAEADYYVLAPLSKLAGDRLTEVIYMSLFGTGAVCCMGSALTS